MAGANFSLSICWSLSDLYTWWRDSTKVTPVEWRDPTIVDDGFTATALEPMSILFLSAGHVDDAGSNLGRDVFERIRPSLYVMCKEKNNKAGRWDSDAHSS